MRGTDSILNIFVFSKFNEMQSFENASGNARLSMMNVCGEIIKNNPLAYILVQITRSWIAVVLANVLAMLPYEVLAPIFTIKKLKNKIEE